MSARPTTTGETASGRSTRALSTRLPGNSCRTSSNAAPTPKIVFITTTHTAMKIVIWNAWIAEWEVSESHTVPTPFSKVRRVMMPTGITRRNARYVNAISRRIHLATAHRPALQEIDREEHHERDHEQHRRHGRRRCGVVALDLAVDVDRGDLRS